jgi:myosin heavy subunit
LLTAQEVEAVTILDPQCLDPAVENLIGLSNLTENAILHNLRIRFKRDLIYTNVSSILIAVNPFRQLPIYNIETLELYKNTPNKATLPPHIFSVADRAFRAMIADMSNQSVVISGESGAGKASLSFSYYVLNCARRKD